MHNKELITLRVSVARAAQAAGIDNHLGVTGLSFGQLCTLASTQERGWNDLMSLIVDHIHAWA